MAALTRKGVWGPRGFGRKGFPPGAGGADRSFGAGPVPLAWAAGRVTLILSVLQLVAAGGIVMGNQLARWFAVAVVGINAIEMMFFIPAYPLWALVIIAVDVVALWGLCAYGSRENLAAV